jgi:adenylate kinase
MHTDKKIKRIRMKHKLIVISGTPGTGKTTLALWLSKKLKIPRLDLHDYYKQISTGYDRSGKCYDIDIKKFEKLVMEKLKESSLIVDTHIAHLLPKKLVNLCIITTCSNLKKLESRLKERKYSKKKNRENLDSEIFQICLNEAKERKHKIIEVDTAKRSSKDELLDKVMKVL